MNKICASLANDTIDTLCFIRHLKIIVYDDDGGVNKYVTDLNKKVLLILYRCFISGRPLGEYLEFLLFFAS